MSKISDELRKWCDLCGGIIDSGDKAELHALADRIDAEHEAKVAYWQEASYKDGYDEGFASADDWLAQHEDAMAEHGWVRLPVDADGVPIHVGDTVWDVEDGMKFVVKSVTLYAGGVTKVDASCEGCHTHVSPKDLTHTRPDSWERIAHDLDDWTTVLADCDVDAAHDLAERIRKLAAKESTR